MAEVQCGNKIMIQSLTDWDKYKHSDSRQMCEAFYQHFARLFTESGEVEYMVDFNPYLNSLLCRSTVDTEHFERKITSVKIQDALIDCTKWKSPGLAGQLYELRANMSDLFSDLFKVLSCSRTRVFPILWAVILPNVEIKIFLAKVLVKKLVLVTGDLVREVQTWAIPTRSINDNLHLVWYII